MVSNPFRNRDASLSSMKKVSCLIIAILVTKSIVSTSKYTANDITAEHHVESSSNSSGNALTPKDAKWPLLITATPRSGTVATMIFLTGLGLDVSNDWCGKNSKPFSHGFVSWIHVMEVQEDENYFGPCQLREQVPKLGAEAMNKTANFGMIVHQTKNVLPSITSLTFTEPLFDQTYASYISRHVNMTGAHTKEQRGLRMWVEWQEHIQKVSSWRYKFEDLLDEPKMHGIVEKIFKSAGEDPPDSSTIHDIWKEWSGKKHNTRKHRPPFTWSELMKIDADDARRAQKLARTYGYDVE